MATYKEYNGTSYHTETKVLIVTILEIARKNKIRLVLDYGDILTGKSWNEIYGINGYIGRSTGTIKIPILIYNNRSIGGGAILDQCIIKISESKGKKVLYQHPTYNK
jgi:hypothetical protein